MALDTEPRRQEEVDISLRDGFHADRAVRARLSPTDIVLVRGDEAFAPRKFEAAEWFTGGVRFRAVFRLRDCADPCEVRVSRLRVAGGVFDLPPARFEPERAFGLWWFAETEFGMCPANGELNSRPATHSLTGAHKDPYALSAPLGSIRP